MQNLSTIPDSSAFVEACKHHLGEHPEDIIGAIDCASDALTQLAELLITIQDIAKRDNPAIATMRIGRIAAIGLHVAHDIANFADSQREKMQAALHGKHEQQAQ